MQTYSILSILTLVFLVTSTTARSDETIKKKSLICSEYTTLGDSPKPWEGQNFIFKFSQSSTGLVIRETTDVDLDDFGDPTIQAVNFKVEKEDQGNGIVEWTLSSDNQTRFSTLLGGPWINMTLKGRLVETRARSRFAYQPKSQDFGDIVGWINAEATNEGSGRIHKIQFVFTCKWLK